MEKSLWIWHLALLKNFQGFRLATKNEIKSTTKIFTYTHTHARTHAHTHTHTHTHTL